MKREAVGTTKMKRLCKLLNVRLYVAVGIMESLWHLTAREAPQGDIGKLSDEDIALGIDWDRSASELIAALVEARWLDRVDGVRLVVHDWAKHSNDSNRQGYGDSKRIRRWKRMRAAGGDIKREIRIAIFARDGRKCITCASGTDLTIDHIHPVSRGGTNHSANLQTLCRSCNSRKKDRLTHGA